MSTKKVIIILTIYSTLLLTLTNSSYSLAPVTPRSPSIPSKVLCAWPTCAGNCHRSSLRLSFGWNLYAYGPDLSEACSICEPSTQILVATSFLSGTWEGQLLVSSEMRFSFSQSWCSYWAQKVCKPITDFFCWTPIPFWPHFWTSQASLSCAPYVCGSSPVALSVTCVYGGLASTCCSPKYNHKQGLHYQW